MGHAYQGFSGIVKTTLVGLVMALLTVFSGSLLVAMVLHTVIDLTSGRMMGAAVHDKRLEHGPGGNRDIHLQGVTSLFVNEEGQKQDRVYLICRWYWKERRYPKYLEGNRWPNKNPS